MSSGHCLAKTTWKTVKSIDYQIAVLPWGATEAHNFHLPYGTDNIQCDYIAEKASRLAWEKGARVVFLPTIPYGVNTGQLDIKLTININPSTQLAILHDIMDCLAKQGINKIVILNGHGGNDFKNMIRELQPEYPDSFFCLINWYKVIDWSDYFQDLGDHGGEMETSIMLHIVPELVLPLWQAGDGKAAKFKLQGLNSGVAWAPRQFTKVSQDTGIGNPRNATAEKGEICLAKIIDKIAAFFVELAACDIKDLYEKF